MDSSPGSARHEATACLVSVAKGDKAAKDRLFELVYAELRDQASAYLRKERADHTLQSTALVHEAWMRMIDQDRVELTDRGHFLALAAIAMRRILVEHARRRGRDKRGGSAQRVTLDGLAAPVEQKESDVDLLDIDRALDSLQKQSPRLARLVELRFFGGLSREEAAEVLGASRSTVAREWRVARALMTSLLSDSGGT